MTNRQADIWVLKKWIYFTKNGWDNNKLFERYPVLMGIKNECAWCEKYKDCDDCPIDNKCAKIFKFCHTVKYTLKQCIKAIKQTRKYKDFSFIDKMLEKEGVNL